MGEYKPLCSISLMLLTAVLSSGANATSIEYGFDEYNAGSGQHTESEATNEMRNEHEWQGEESPGLELALEHRTYGDSEDHRHGVDHVWGGEGFDHEMDRERGDEGSHHEMDRESGGEASHHGMDHEWDGERFSHHEPLHERDGEHDGWGDGREGWGHGQEGWGHGHEGWGEHDCKKRFCMEDPKVVPLPAAAWLFISGLIGILGIARHSSSSQV